MIDYLAATIASMSFLLALLLLTRRFLLNMFGPQMCYQLWLLLPLCLLVPFIPNQAVISLDVGANQIFIVTQTIVNSLDTWGAYAWLLFLWTIGASVITIMFGIQHFYFLKTLKLSASAKTDVTKSDSTIPVYVNAKLASPILNGLFNPKIYVPAKFFTQYSPIQQTLILAHENYHHKRLDILWNYLALVILVTFWFHPLCWLAFARFKQDQELSCDQAVLTTHSTYFKQQYAHALLASLEHRVTDVTPKHTVLMPFGKSGDTKMINERIKQVKDAKVSNKLLTLFVLVIAVIGLSTELYATSDKNPLLEQLINMKPIVKINPTYPAKAAVDEIEGYVTLEFGITSNGTVENIRIINSEPAGTFDSAAQKAVASWRYAPHDVKSAVSTVTLDFKLDD